MTARTPTAGVVASHGVDIAWWEQGNGPPVLLLHGVGAASESYDAIVRQLDSRFRLLRYDLRGHGESGKPAGPYALADYIADAVALLDARGIQRAHMVGFSFGGMIAQAIAATHPQRVDALVLISSVAARSDEERTRIRARASTLESGGAASTIDAALERWFTPAFREAHPEIVEQRIKLATANDPAGYAAAYRVFAESDMDEELQAIRARTLVMTGEHDVGSTPRMARLIHQRVAGSRLEILPGLRHSVLAEAPELIAKHLLRFL